MRKMGICKRKPREFTSNSVFGRIDQGNFHSLKLFFEKTLFSFHFLRTDVIDIKFLKNLRTYKHTKKVDYKIPRIAKISII